MATSDPQLLAEPLLDAERGCAAPAGTAQHSLRVGPLAGAAACASRASIALYALSIWIANWLMVAFVVVGSLSYGAALMMLAMAPVALIALIVLLATGQL